MKLLVVVIEVLVESLLSLVILELMLLIFKWLLETSRLRPTAHLLLHLLGPFPTSLCLLSREKFSSIVSLLRERRVITIAAFICILVKIIMALINLVIGFTLQLLLLLLDCGLLRRVRTRV